MQCGSSLHAKAQASGRGACPARTHCRATPQVVVIGPYRSGKSFLLNQMLGVKCGGWDSLVAGGGVCVDWGPAWAYAGSARAAQPARHSMPGPPSAMGGLLLAAARPCWRLAEPPGLATLPADEGFGVGHQRVTQTKGVWMWGEPMPVTVDGRTINVSSGRGGRGEGGLLRLAGSGVGAAGGAAAAAGTGAYVGE